MASLVTHLVIGQEHLKQFKEYDSIDFLKGTLDPDYLHIAYEQDKAKLHYGLPHNENLTQQQNFKNKTFLEKFLKENKIDTSYKRGYFLHLIADYYFYNELVKIDRVNKFSDKVSKKVLFDDHEKVQGFLIKKYSPMFELNLESVQFIKENYSEIREKGKPTLFDLQDFENYIEFCSKIDLDDFARKILIKNQS